MQDDSVKAPLATLHVLPENVVFSAHYGYVYCMALLPSNREGSDDAFYEDTHDGSLQLVTGSGDSTVKVGDATSESVAAVSMLTWSLVVAVVAAPARADAGRGAAAPAYL